MTTTFCGLGGRGIKLQNPVINLIHPLPSQCVQEVKKKKRERAKVKRAQNLSVKCHSCIWEKTGFGTLNGSQVLPKNSWGMLSLHAGTFCSGWGWSAVQISLRDDTCALECTCRFVLSCVAPPSPNTPLNNKLTSVLVYVWSGRSRCWAWDVKMAVQIRRYPCQSGTINRCKDAKILSSMTYLIRCLSG